MFALRYKKDIVPVGLAYIALVASLIAWSYDPITQPVWFAAWVLLAFLFRVPLLPHQHNHSHLRTFTSPSLNAAHDFVLQILTGYTTAGWDLQHTLGHHRLFKGKDDPTRVGRFAKPNGSVGSRVWHSFMVETLSFYDSWVVAAGLKKHLSSKMKKRLLLEAGLQHLTYLILFLINPVATLVVFIVINKFLRFLVVYAAYDHHYRADVPNFKGSNNKLPCPWYLFNLGYHEAHHVAPSAHWTRLPDIFRKITRQNDHAKVGV